LTLVPIILSGSFRRGVCAKRVCPGAVPGGWGKKGTQIGKVPHP